MADMMVQYVARLKDSAILHFECIESDRQW